MYQPCVSNKENVAIDSYIELHLIQPTYNLLTLQIHVRYIKF
jgi:hypothetical protein